MKNNIKIEKTSKPRFTFDDWGWVVLSVGMGIGAGIAFAPIPVSMCGLWIFLAVALIGYPGIFLFQQMFIEVMGSAEENLSYTDFLNKKLGKFWGNFIGLLYFFMLFIWFFVYSEAIVKDSASYLVSFGLLKSSLSGNLYYVAGIIILLVAIAACGEKLLFKIGSFLSISIIVILFLIGLIMVPDWSFARISPPPTSKIFIRNGIWLLPFVLTSILFLQSLSPMTVWFRENSEDRESALYRTKRANFIAFAILFSVVFFYVLSFIFAITQAQAKTAYSDNISALALLARIHTGFLPRILDLLLETFAILTSFFAIYLSLRESLFSAFTAFFKKYRPGVIKNKNLMNRVIAVFLIMASISIVMFNAPILMFTAICSPVFGIVGCLIPAWIVLKEPQLKKHIGPKLFFVIFVGILLVSHRSLIIW